jgi:hypothetical protein
VPGEQPRGRQSRRTGADHYCGCRVAHAEGTCRMVARERRQQR